MVTEGGPRNPRHPVPLAVLGGGRNRTDHRGVGQCILDGCAGDWSDCNGYYEDGCETDLAHDAHNCDVCFTPCKRPAHGIAGCSARMCGIGGCDPGWEDCDGDPENGCEHEIWTDAECLTCKLPCPDGKHCDQGVCI